MAATAAPVMLWPLAVARSVEPPAARMVPPMTEPVSEVTSTSPVAVVVKAVVKLTSFGCAWIVWVPALVSGA